MISNLQADGIAPRCSPEFADRYPCCCCVCCKMKWWWCDFAIDFYTAGWGVGVFASPARALEYHYFFTATRWLVRPGFPCRRACTRRKDKESRHGTTKWDESQTKTMATLLLTRYSTRDFSTPAGQLGQRHIIISQRPGLVTCSQTRHRCVAGASLPARRGGMRSLIIRLGCPPRRAVGSASFRGDGWIL